MRGASEATVPVPREILRFRPGHRVELYDRGRAAIDAMREAVASARHHVHLETYILRGDETGRGMLEALAERARAGVDVRLIFDAIGSHGLDRRLLADAARAGVEVAEFNPPSRWIWRFRPRLRDHRKVLVVDGRVGFLGGLNLGDEYVGEDESGPTWRDAHARLEGPVLTDLQALFLESWFRSGGESFDWRDLMDRDEAAPGGASVALLADGPMYRRRRMRDFFLDQLALAEERVLLVTPYFAPGSRVLDALERAGERGVRIELLLAGYSDHPILRRAARALIPRLLERGVRVYEEAHRMMHAKLAVFDERIAVLGTSNLDRQSLHHSLEVNAIFEGSEVARWIWQHFGEPVGSVVPVELDGLSRRPWWTRGIDRLAAALVRL